MTPPFPSIHLQSEKFILERVRAKAEEVSSKTEPFPLFRTMSLTSVCELERIPEYPRLNRGVSVSVASVDSLPEIVMCVSVILPVDVDEIEMSEHPLPNVISITIVKLDISNEPVDRVNTDDSELNSDVIVRIALLSSFSVVFITTSLSPISITSLSFV